MCFSFPKQSAFTAACVHVLIIWPNAKRERDSGDIFRSQELDKFKKKKVILKQLGICCFVLPWIQ